ncbi:hypothetical protein EI94DRAFT_1568889 [Lactarius quietus]|nr:hypothetical protein EI94DRAFT_1568889 [Lactarius quietus]
MNNPHAERQAVLLERITKNAEKCTELILELNHCVEEIIQANAYVKLAALLATKYSRNAQYNLEVTPATGSEVHQTSDPAGSP